MSIVKTYHSIDRSNQKSNFAISKMEDIYDKRNGAKDHPHRHDFFTVLIIVKAKGFHKIDFNSYDFEKSQIFFVSPGQVHQLVEEQKSYGFVMTFNHQFLIENNIQISFIEDLNLFQDYGHSPPLLPTKKDFETILNFCYQIFDLFKSNKPMYNLSIGAYFKLFLIECNNICNIEPLKTNHKNTDKNYISDFKNLVNKFYKKNHSTTFYADKLNITPDHLNRVIKKQIGKTTKEYIQNRIIVEAKRLLLSSNLSFKEIGFELGFNEPTNFSAFFKKQTGESLSEFSKSFS